jgi:hypothetical protein
MCVSPRLSVNAAFVCQLASVCVSAASVCQLTSVCASAARVCQLTSVCQFNACVLVQRMCVSPRLPVSAAFIY